MSTDTPELKKDPEHTKAPEPEEQQQQHEAHEPLVKHSARPHRTVLHGYGKLDSNKIHRIDRTIFVGGIARNVLKETAKCWATGMRPENSTKPYAMDGKEAYSSVGITILDDDATEADCMKAVGVVPMATSKFAQLLKAYTAKDLAQELGPVKTAELIASLKEANAGNQ